jgi:pimeloyl-ACP methyl ester carboxylesterase
MSSYVLVHGAYGGGWVWKDIVPLLRGAGHDVFPVTLTGLGERMHLASPEINLSTHIEDVANVIRFEGLTNVVLVGHSYGGMVITGVADRMPDPIDRVVYVDAQLPHDGESLVDLNGTTPPSEDQWLVQPPAVPPGMAPGTLDNSKLTPQPRATMVEKLRLAKPIEGHVFGRTFIKATKAPRMTTGPGAGLWRAADRVRNHPAWDYREIDTGHLVQVEKPVELAELLLSLE